MNLLIGRYIRNFSSNTRAINPSNIILIRHAQSIFNARCQQYDENEVYGKDAQNKFHYDIKIMDCQITESAIKNSNKAKLRQIFKKTNHTNTIFFVSPMLRTLQTTQLILQNIQKQYRIKVIPQLTQILSKICDFSTGIKNKKVLFNHFDFCYLDQWMKGYQLSEDVQNWQDPFIDRQYTHQIKHNEIAGLRYISLLQSVFPKQLENVNKCIQRSVFGFNMICKICQEERCQNAVLVSHNRILKYIQMEIMKNNAKDFQNFQIRIFQIGSNREKKLQM